MTPGRFITIEGGEGTGKSTLINGLKAYFLSSGRDVLFTREPGGTVLAEAIRKLVLTPPDDQHWSPLAEALLMNAARADHVEKVIAPALSAGQWVICDRFSDSTRVYQGIGGVADSVLKAMEAEVTRSAYPDLTIILDAPVEALTERRRTRGVQDAFEIRPMTFHVAVRDAFLEIAESEPDRVILLDALKSSDEVLIDATSAIEERLV